MVPVTITVNGCTPGNPAQCSTAGAALPGTIVVHAEYDFGKGQLLIDISRGKPGSGEGDWYSINVVAPYGRPYLSGGGPPIVTL